MANILDSIKGLFTGGAADAPAAEGEATDAALPALMEENDLNKWKGRIDRAQTAGERYWSWWDTCLKEYAPQVTENPAQWRLRVRTNRAFAVVERKTGDLFFRQPDVTVKASPLLEDLELQQPLFKGLPSVHASIMNEKLGLDGVDVVSLMATATFNLELFGCGWTKIGYETYTKPLPTTVPGEPIQQLDPVTGVPTMMPGKDRIEIADVPIYSECYWRPCSNKSILIPDDCRSLDFDKDASFLGRRFQMSLPEARRKWGKRIPNDWKPGTPSKRMYFDHGVGSTVTSATSDDIVTGVELWYKTALFEETEIHPQHLTWLVLLDGLPDAVEKKPCPDQTFDEQGRLTPDSLIGYPLVPVFTRLLSDSPYVMSDVAVGLPQTMELDAFREIAQEQRRINLLKFIFNTGEITAEELKTCFNAMQGGAVGLPPRAFASARGPLRALDIQPIPPDDWALDAKLDNDHSQTMGIDANAQGVQAAGDQTATEAGITQANRNVRSGKETNAVAACYMRGVTKFSTLIQRYLSIEDAAAIVGQNNARLWDQWRHAIPTRLAFTMVPDSQLRNDTPVQRKQLMDAITYAANDPNTNRRYLWEQYWTLCHIDPTKALLPLDQVPQPKPGQPTPSLAFKGDDFSPLNPQSPVMVDLFTKITGIQVDPEAMRMALGLAQLMSVLPPAQPTTNGAGPKPTQPPHGGKLAQMESLDKHQGDETGAMQATGEITPQMAGGMGQVQ